jgi:multiple sugar transport system permease protein
MAGKSPARELRLVARRPSTRLVGWWDRHGVREGLGRLVLYAGLIVGSGAFLLPLYYLLNMALSTPGELSKYPPDIIPHPIQYANFWDGWNSYYPFLQLLGNTITIAVLATIGQLVSCTLAAYGFARLRFPLRNFWFVVLLGTLMLPSQVTLIPQYVIFAKLQWVNTFKPLIVPAYFGSAFYIFLLRQFFMTMPRELDDAARIDGCGFARTLAQVLLPLCKSPLVAVAVFSFVGHWSDFFGPLIYLNAPDKFTMVLGTTIAVLSLGDAYFNLGYIMAMVTVTIIPILVLYFWAQRYFIEGIALTGVRG